MTIYVQAYLFLLLLDCQDRHRSSKGVFPQYFRIEISLLVLKQAQVFRSYFIPLLHFLLSIYRLYFFSWIILPLRKDRSFCAADITASFRRSFRDILLDFNTNKRTCDSNKWAVSCPWCFVWNSHLSGPRWSWHDGAIFGASEATTHWYCAAV